jgi:hypothetical protein
MAIVLGSIVLLEGACMARIIVSARGEAKI